MEVLKDLLPGRVFVGAAPVAFIDDDQIKEVPLCGFSGSPI